MSRGPHPAGTRPSAVAGDAASPAAMAESMIRSVATASRRATTSSPPAQAVSMPAVAVSVSTFSTCTEVRSPTS